MHDDFELWLKAYFKDYTLRGYIQRLDPYAGLGDLEDYMLEYMMWLAYQAGYRRRVLSEMVQQDQEDGLI